MSEMFINLILSLLLGIIIGLERGVRTQKNIGEIVGIRTFGFIALFGALSGYVGIYFHYSFTVVSLFCLSIFLTTLYIMEVKIERGVGATTVVVAFITFIIGVLIALDFRVISIALTVIVAFLLSLKPKLHGFIERIEDVELYAMLKFLLITVCVLPFLPNKNYGPWEAFNPFQIWFFVVLIAGLSFIGYVFIKFLGPKKGILITSVFGGLASSTALTISMSKISKNYSNPQIVFSGILIAWSIMFLRVLAISVIINDKLFNYLIFPVIFMFLLFIVLATLFWLIFSNNKKLIYQNLDKDYKQIFDNPLQLSTAFKFGLLLLMIIYLTHVFKFYFEDAGIYIISLISGIIDVDAIAISVSDLSRKNIDLITASKAIVLASFMNTIFKGMFVLFTASKKLNKYTLYVLAIIIVAGIIYFFCC